MLSPSRRPAEQQVSYGRDQQCGRARVDHLHCWEAMHHNDAGAIRGSRDAFTARCHHAGAGHDFSLGVQHDALPPPPCIGGHTTLP